MASPFDSTGVRMERIEILRELISRSLNRRQSSDLIGQKRRLLRERKSLPDFKHLISRLERQLKDASDLRDKNQASQNESGCTTARVHPSVNSCDSEDGTRATNQSQRDANFWVKDRTAAHRNYLPSKHVAGVTQISDAKLPQSHNKAEESKTKSRKNAIRHTQTRSLGSALELGCLDTELIYSMSFMKPEELALLNSDEMVLESLCLDSGLVFSSRTGKMMRQSCIKSDDFAMLDTAVLFPSSLSRGLDMKSEDFATFDTGLIFPSPRNNKSKTELGNKWSYHCSKTPYYKGPAHKSSQPAPVNKETCVSTKTLPHNAIQSNSILSSKLYHQTVKDSISSKVTEKPINSVNEYANEEKETKVHEETNICQSNIFRELIQDAQEMQDPCITSPRKNMMDATHTQAMKAMIPNSVNDYPAEPCVLRKSNIDGYFSRYDCRDNQLAYDDESQDSSSQQVQNRHDSRLPDDHLSGNSSLRDHYSDDVDNYDAHHLQDTERPSEQSLNQHDIFLPDDHDGFSMPTDYHPNLQGHEGSLEKRVKNKDFSLHENHHVEIGPEEHDTTFKHMKDHLEDLAADHGVPYTSSGQVEDDHDDYTSSGQVEGDHDDQYSGDPQVTDNKLDSFFSDGQEEQSCEQEENQQDDNLTKCHNDQEQNAAFSNNDQNEIDIGQLQEVEENQQDVQHALADDREDTDTSCEQIEDQQDVLSADDQNSSNCDDQRGPCDELITQNVTNHIYDSEDQQSCLEHVPQCCSNEVQDRESPLEQTENPCNDDDHIYDSEDRESPLEQAENHRNDDEDEIYCNDDEDIRSSLEQIYGSDDQGSCREQIYDSEDRGSCREQIYCSEDQGSCREQLYGSEDQQSSPEHEENQTNDSMSDDVHAEGMAHDGSLPDEGMTRDGSLHADGMAHDGSLADEGMTHDGSFDDEGMTHDGSCHAGGMALNVCLPDEDRTHDGSFSDEDMTHEGSLSDEDMTQQGSSFDEDMSHGDPQDKKTSLQHVENNDDSLADDTRDFVCLQRFPEHEDVNNVDVLNQQLFHEHEDVTNGSVLDQPQSPEHEDLTNGDVLDQPQSPEHEDVTNGDVLGQKLYSEDEDSTNGDVSDQRMSPQHEDATNRDVLDQQLYSEDEDSTNGDVSDQRMSPQHGDATNRDVSEDEDATSGYVSDQQMSPQHGDATNKDVVDQQLYSEDEDATNGDVSDRQMSPQHGDATNRDVLGQQMSPRDGSLPDDINDDDYTDDDYIIDVDREHHEHHEHQHRYPKDDSLSDDINVDDAKEDDQHLFLEPEDDQQNEYDSLPSGLRVEDEFPQRFLPQIVFLDPFLYADQRIMIKSARDEISILSSKQKVSMLGLLYKALSQSKIELQTPNPEQAWDPFLVFSVIDAAQIGKKKLNRHLESHEGSQRLLLCSEAMFELMLSFPAEELMPMEFLIQNLKNNSLSITRPRDSVVCQSLEGFQDQDSVKFWETMINHATYIKSHMFSPVEHIASVFTIILLPASRLRKMPGNSYNNKTNFTNLIIQLLNGSDREIKQIEPSLYRGVVEKVNGRAGVPVVNETSTPSCMSLRMLGGCLPWSKSKHRPDSSNDDW